MELPDSIRQQLAAEIERERRACGCKSGAAFAIGGFILGVVWWTTFSPHVTVAGGLEPLSQCGLLHGADL